MKIGILGSDDRAVAIGRLLASGGHDVTVGDPRGCEPAQQASATFGGGAETPYDQAMTRELLVFALPRNEIDQAITSMGSGPHGIVVDAVDGGPDEPGQGAQLLAHKLDSHTVVRALIVLPQPGANIPICGDDEDAKRVVGEAFKAAGCLTTDRGPLANASELEPKGPSIAA